MTKLKRGETGGPGECINVVEAHQRLSADPTTLIALDMKAKGLYNCTIHALASAVRL